MRHVHTIISFIAIFAFAFLGFCSCIECNLTLESEFSGTSWSGTYKIQEIINDSQKMEELIGTISLDFEEGNTCFVTKGIEGLYAANRTVYSVKYSSRKSFSLYPDDDTNAIISYSGTSDGNKLTLQALNCDSIAAIYELKRVR